MLVWAVIAASMASTVGVGVWLVELSVAESVNISQRGQAQGEGKDGEREATASRGQIYIWYKVLLQEFPSTTLSHPTINRFLDLDLFL